MIQCAPLSPLVVRFLDALSSAYSRRIQNFPHSESTIIYIHYWKRERERNTSTEIYRNLHTNTGYLWSTLNVTAWKKNNRWRKGKRKEENDVMHGEWMKIRRVGRKGDERSRMNVFSGVMKEWMNFWRRMLLLLLFWCVLFVSTVDMNDYQNML